MDSASHRLPFGGILQQGNNFGRRHTSYYGVYRCVTYCMAGVDNEDGWLGDPAFHSWIVNAPVLNDSTFCIAQNWKRQREICTQGFRFGGCIHRNSYDARARGLDFQVVLPIVRQLAEAESSPIAAIEEQDQTTVRDQLRQAAWHLRRVWQFEFPCKLARDGNL
jgi:hypothetical protein